MGIRGKRAPEGLGTWRYPGAREKGARCSGGEQGDRKQVGALQHRAEQARPACHRRPLPAGAEDRRGPCPVLAPTPSKAPCLALGSSGLGFPTPTTLGSVSESSPGGGSGRARKSLTCRAELWACL